MVNFRLPSTDETIFENKSAYGGKFDLQSAKNAFEVLDWVNNKSDELQAEFDPIEQN